MGAGADATQTPVLQADRSHEEHLQNLTYRTFESDSVLKFASDGFHPLTSKGCSRRNLCLALTTKGTL